MDMSRMSQGQMVAGVGGVLLLIGLFLDWVSLPGGFGGSAFDVFSGMDILLLIVAVLAIGWAAAGPAGMTAPTGSAWIVGLLGVGAIGWCLGWDLENPDAGIGAWLGLVGSIAIAWGALEGGRRPAMVRASPAGPAASSAGPASSTTPTSPPPTTPAV